MLNKVDFCGYPVVNIDDHSNLDEQKRVKNFDDNNIHYEINKGKVQLAVKQGIEYLSKVLVVNGFFVFSKIFFQWKNLSSMILQKN